MAFEKKSTFTINTSLQLVASEKLKIDAKFHTGIVHCKGSLFGRELAMGPLASQNQNYLDMMMEAGVMASEMETSPLFIQTQLYNYQLQKMGDDPKHQVLAGAILAVTGLAGMLEETPMGKSALHDAIELALETTKILATQELSR